MSDLRDGSQQPGSRQRIKNINHRKRTQANRDLYLLVAREQVVFAVFETYNQQLVTFLESAISREFVRPYLVATMLTGLIFDRIGNQIMFASWIRKTSGHNIVTDEAYRKRWLKANLDLFLHGILAA